MTTKPDTPYQDEALRIESALLPAEEVRALSRLAPWRSVGQGLLEWGWIGLLVALARWLDSWALYPVWVLLIASRQHALAILMHDAAHGRIHPDRAWNDRIGEWLFAWPLLTSLGVYRRTHLAHHKHLQTPLDADWRIWRDHAYYWFPKSRAELLGEILRFSLGLRTPQLFRFLRDYANRDARPAALRGRGTPASSGGRTRRYARGLAYAALVLGLVLSGAWWPVLLYWVVPLLTALMGILYIRAIAEHFISEQGGPSSLACSRSMIYSLAERILVAPLHVGYHLEHHLYPSVPFFRLPELHRRLMQVEHFRVRAHRTRGVRGVLEECAGSRSTRELWARQEAAARAG